MPLPSEDTTPPVTKTKRVKVVSLKLCVQWSPSRENRMPAMSSTMIRKDQDRRADRLANRARGRKAEFARRVTSVTRMRGLTCADCRGRR